MYAGACQARAGRALVPLFAGAESERVSRQQNQIHAAHLVEGIQLKRYLSSVTAQWAALAEMAEMAERVAADRSAPCNI